MFEFECKFFIVEKEDYEIVQNPYDLVRVLARIQFFFFCYAWKKLDFLYTVY